MLAQIALMAFAMCLGFAFAGRTLAMIFRPYDDEGYMLLSLVHYFREGGLYTKTYSQYGPFYFWAQALCFRLLRLPVTHDAGRLVTLIYWMLSGFLGGQFVYRLTNNTMLASVGLLACIVQGAVLANEPGHPQQVVLLLLMAAVWFACWRGPRTRNLYLFFLGATVAAMLFTKINVGVFLIAALVHSLSCLLRPGLIRTAVTASMVFYAVVVPPVLMHADLLGWAANYCMVAMICGGTTFLCGAWLRPDNPMPARGILPALLGIGATASVIIGGTLAQGVSLGVLLRGVVLDPLKHPRVFFLPMLIGRVQLAFIILAAGGVFAACFLAYRRTGQRWTGALQCLTGLVVLFLLFFGHHLHAPPTPHIALLMPFLPVGIISSLNRSRSVTYLFPRLFLTDLAATQFLQPYPVSGSQAAIAAAPIVLWTFMCIFDGFDDLQAILGNIVSPFEPVSKELLLTVLTVIAFSVGFVRLVYSDFWSPYPYPNSTLIGSSSLHLPQDQEERYLFLADSIRRNCNMLFTVPGMGSFNFWSGVPTPNGSNLTGWINAFDTQRQEEILNLLIADSNACVLYNPDLVQSWRSSPEQLARSRLGAYILLHMVKVVDRDGYEIRVQPENESWSVHP
jgi:hypothetical protein